MKSVNFYKKKNEEKGEGLTIAAAKKSSGSLLLKNKVLVGIISIVVLLFLAVSAYANFMKRPVSSDPKDYQYLEIEKGETTWDIGEKLEEKGIIRSKLAFFLTSKIEERGALQSGNYKLSASMSTDEIVQKIRDGKVDAFTVTIPEGYRVLQIAKTLGEKGKINVQKFIEAATGTEGTLFPDTYVFPYDTEPSKIVKTMKDDFEKRTKGMNLSSDQLVLASLVEREAKDDTERPKIAAVYKNRADNNMLFQADPTVQYALDTQRFLKNQSVDFTFWQSITKDDYLNSGSPFNTYKNKGYPPAPICNPGIKSIEAALHPEENFDYLYFFHDRDLNIHFSKTYAEQMEAIQQYGVAGS